MSHKAESRIFTVPAELVPSAADFQQRYQELCITAGGAAYQRKDKLHHVFGSTRSGYAIYTLKNILKLKPFPAIEFLTDTGHQYRLKGEFGQELRVTVLDRARQAQVIAALHQLLIDLKANPDVVYEAEDFGHLMDGDVEAALDHDYVSASPAYDREVRGNDGEGADYLFVYLRSVLKVIQNAYEEGLVVVYQLEL
ncbi:MAG: hypothetical protein ACXWC4_19300 [Telluria sp.]